MQLRHSQLNHIGKTSHRRYLVIACFRNGSNVGFAQQSS